MQNMDFMSLGLCHFFKRPKLTAFDAVRTFACVAFYLVMLSAGHAAGANSAIPMVYLAGSGNPVLDTYFTNQLREVIGNQVIAVPISGSSIALEPAIPIITIGPKALTATLGQHPNSPVVATLVSEEFFRSMGSALTGTVQPRHVSAIFYDVPLLRQALTGKAILPHARKIALLASPQSIHLYSDFLQQLSSFGLEAQIFVVESSDQLIPTLVRALDYGDFLLAAHDPNIYNSRTIKHILLTAYRRNIMMIGPSQAYVKAGSLASSYAPYSAVVAAVADNVEQWFNNNTLPAPRYLAYFKVQINEQVGRSLNIPLPSEISVEDQVQQQLRSTEQTSVNNPDTEHTEVLQ